MFETRQNEFFMPEVGKTTSGLRLSWKKNKLKKTIIFLFKENIIIYFTYVIYECVVMC